jgi:hypothetical protein
MISRRSFLGSSAVVALAGASGCSLLNSNNPNGAVQTVAGYANDIASGLENFLQVLVTSGTTVAGLTPALLASIKQIVADVAQAAQQIQSASTAAEAQPLVQAIETYVNHLVAIVAALPLPPPINLYVMGAATLLPLLEQLVNLAVDQVTQANAAKAQLAIEHARVPGVPQNVTVEERARAILRQPPQAVRRQLQRR